MKMYANTYTCKIWGIYLVNTVCKAANLFIRLEQFHICQIFFLCWHFIAITFMDISYSSNMAQTILKMYVMQVVDVLQFDTVIFLKY